MTGGTGPSMTCLNLGSAPAQAWWAVNGTGAAALPASFSLAGDLLRGRGPGLGRGLMKRVRAELRPRG